MLSTDEQDIAAGEARRARHLAEAAAIADQIALAEPGDDFDGAPPPPVRSSLGRDSSLLEWGRRSLAAEIGCALRRPESTATRLIGDAEHLVDLLPATLAALETGQISYQHARKMIAHAGTLPYEAQAGSSTTSSRPPWWRRRRGSMTTPAATASSRTRSRSLNAPPKPKTSAGSG